MVLHVEGGKFLWYIDNPESLVPPLIQEQHGIKATRPNLARMIPVLSVYVCMKPQVPVWDLRSSRPTLNILQAAYSRET